MPRAIFSGSISFGLVNIPIKIYNAVQERQLSFHTLCKEGHPLEYKKWCPVERREVKWEEVQKGYKITAEKFIILKKEDFQKIKLKTTKTIDIEEFVDAPQIDPIYIDKSYFVAPDEAGIKAYSLFVEALRLQNKIAIGKLVMRDREYLVALRAYKKGIVMHALHFLGEIKDIEELPEIKKLIAVKEEELKLAQTLITKLTSDEFEISKYKDAYTEALKKMIKAKAEGKEFIVEEEKPAEEAKELMEALKASVEVAPIKRKKKS